MRALVVLALILLAGCATRQSRVDDYLAKHPDTPPALEEKLREGVLRQGMTKEQVRASWGDPCAPCPGSGSTVYAGLQVDSWVYNVFGPARPSLNTYVYFQDGVVVGWSQP